MSESNSKFLEKLINSANAAFEDLVRDLEKELGNTLTEEEKNLSRNY